MPAALAPRKLRPAFVAQSVLMGSALAVYLFVLGSAGLHHQDLDPYLVAGRHVWNGEPLYATFLQHPFPDPTLRPAFIYPPAFALLTLASSTELGGGDVGGGDVDVLSALD